MWVILSCGIHHRRLRGTAGAPGAGTSGCNSRPSDANRGNEDADAFEVASVSGMPVNTGLPGTECSQEAIEDTQEVVSERGLEPPRDNVPLGHYPAPMGTSASNSGTLGERWNVCHGFCLCSPGTPSQVPAQVEPWQVESLRGSGTHRSRDTSPVELSAPPRLLQPRSRWRVVPTRIEATRRRG